MNYDIKSLLGCIEKKLNWGESSHWQHKDFDQLSSLIFDETGVSLSASTLKRVWGKVAYTNIPSVTTLDALAKFAGFDSWRNFINSAAAPETEERPAIPHHTSTPSKQRRKFILITCLSITIVLITLALQKVNTKPGRHFQFEFSSEPLTRGIPNTVVFKYNANDGLDDSVFIQQSWDEGTKTSVDKKAHVHTSIYYEPGFYHAKLIEGNQVVKEHSLLVGTKGWLALIENKPAPVYLDSNEFMKAGMLRVTDTVLQHNNINLQPNPPVLRFYNAGNFKAVPVNNFSFSTEIRNEYKEGAAACQLTYVILMTDDAPIIIPLSIKGCVSELFLNCVDVGVSGKKENLEGFGVDFNNWVKVSCKSDSSTVKFMVNEKAVYACPLPKKPVHIIGISYYFMGTGAVRNIELQSNGLTMFKAY